jgi:predicted ATPase
LHERIGAAIEELYANLIEDHLDELAHHYSRSGNLTKALEYHERAGRQAVQRSAYTDAMRAFTAAIELLMKMPESPQRELDLQTTLGSVLMITKRWAAPETERAYHRAQELAQSGGTAAQSVSLLMGLFRTAYVGGRTAYVGGRLVEARERLERVRTFVRRRPEPEFLLELYHLDWSFALSTGELEAAQRRVEDGLAFYQAQPGSVPVTFYSAHHPAVCGHVSGAIIFWLRGYPEAARRHADQAVALGHETGHSPSVKFALGQSANVHQIAGEVAKALETAEAAKSLAEKDGVPVFESWARVTMGWALAQLGEAEQGVAQIRQGLAMASATGAKLWHTYNLAQLADACGKAGRLEEGLRAIAEALDLVQQHGERWWEAEILRLHGELLLKQNPSDLAAGQAWLGRAIEVARQQGAKSLELRATMSLARLLNEQGKRDEARTMLGEIYGWFTEGFDTADLKDAKALLDELEG